MIKGVDLSVFNGEVDFAALQAAGIGFVILRCGYGRDYPGQEDARFAENVRRAEACGMPWGAYHYSYARDEAGGREEAAHALRLLGGRKPAYGLWFDMEDSSTLGGDLAGAARGFCGAAEEAGLYAGVYANLHWWRSYLTDPVFDRWDRWVAQYNATCDLQKPYGMWQFTDKLNIGGKLFDGDWAYRDYPALTGSLSGAPALSSEEFSALMDRWMAQQAAKPATWEDGAIAFCLEHGLMQGTGDGFAPKALLTRGEAAQIAENLYLAMRNEELGIRN